MQDDAKRETQKQWTTDPCGARTAPEHETGTPEFFRKVEHVRYDVYAPWMREAIGFTARKGYRLLLSDIEYRSPGSEAVPLVKVVGRRDRRRLFQAFRETRPRPDQIEWSHLVPFAAPGSGPSRPHARVTRHRWGWSLTVLARK